MTCCCCSSKSLCSSSHLFLSYLHLVFKAKKAEGLKRERKRKCEKKAVTGSPPEKSERFCQTWTKWYLSHLVDRISRIYMYTTGPFSKRMARINKLQRCTFSHTASIVFWVQVADWTFLTQWTIEAAWIKVTGRSGTCIRARLMLVCELEVTRYHLVQVWQKLSLAKIYPG